MECTVSKFADDTKLNDAVNKPEGWDLTQKELDKLESGLPGLQQSYQTHEKILSSLQSSPALCIRKPKGCSGGRAEHGGGKQTPHLPPPGTRTQPHGHLGNPDGKPIPTSRQSRHLGNPDSKAIPTSSQQSRRGGRWQPACTLPLAASPLAKEAEFPLSHHVNSAQLWRQRVSEWRPGRYRIGPNCDITPDPFAADLLAPNYLITFWLSITGVHYQSMVYIKSTLLSAGANPAPYLRLFLVDLGVFLWLLHYLRDSRCTSIEQGSAWPLETQPQPASSPLAAHPDPHPAGTHRRLTPSSRSLPSPFAPRPCTRHGPNQMPPARRGAGGQRHRQAGERGMRTPLSEGGEWRRPFPKPTVPRPGTARRARPVSGVGAARRGSAGLGRVRLGGESRSLAEAAGLTLAVTQSATGKEPGSRSNLGSLHENVISDTSDWSEKKITDKKGFVEQRTMTLTEKSGYPDTVYVNAAKIFQVIHTEKPKERMLVRYGDGSLSPMQTFKHEYSQCASYELAFSALKYQDLLEEVLLDSGSYPCHSIPDELTSLLVVMLYDLQDRKFQARKIFDKEEPVEEIQQVEHYLDSFKTKLAAALARYRIKHGAVSIESFLPESIRKQEQRASALPLYVWINTLKISLQDVFRELELKGFTRVQSVSDLDHYTYCMDQHCPDVLVFPSSLKEELLNLDLFAECKLLLQDKSRILAVHSSQALLNIGDDIIVAHLGSHLTIAHLSVLTNHSISNIFVCGMKSSAKAEELKNLFSHMECKNIHLLHEDFTEIDPVDARLENAKVILLLPQCSGLGVGNPIDFIVNDHGDAGLLRDLFQGCVSVDKLNILAERQLNELMHAMKFNKVQAIVYCTCSLYSEENELVVKKALESGVEGNKVKPYRLIPPVFNTCSNSDASTELFFKMEPSESSSGCFLAILEREKDPENVTPNDILSRAASKGLLDGIGVKKSKEEKKQRKVTQRRHRIPGRGIEPKPAELHQPPLSNIKAEVSVSNIRQKNMSQTSSSVQLKKSINPISDKALPEVLKHTSHLSPAGKVTSERQTFARKPRAERKKLSLKTVDIVFPPGLTPQGNKPRISTQQCFHCLTKAKAARTLLQPVSKGIKPAVHSHPHPWL
ncbi:putative methyltransferase NSUN7 [Phaethornis superciliosus]